jgi:hypothetical protein
MNITSSHDIRNLTNFQLAIGSNVSHMLESNSYGRNLNQQFGLCNNLGDAVEFEADRISSKSRDRIKSHNFYYRESKSIRHDLPKKTAYFLTNI